MKTITLFLTTGLLLIAMNSIAQNDNNSTTKQKTHHTAAKKKAKGSMPDWAKAHGYTQPAHIYLPDYYTFYDASRGGYVFWQDNQWTFSPSMPLYLNNVDLNKAQVRVQILKGLTLDMHPEQNYPRYMKLYPARSSSPEVPVPTPQNE